ncbi:MAG TPA: universal stress protein [Gemmatimonadaceae bacterium]|nr:universal stress protein [Gemmatimonadaceae bacterium]
MSDPAAHRHDPAAESAYPPVRQASSGPILVATDGSAAGEAAFRAAVLVAAKLSVSVRVIVVVEPLPVLVPEPSLIMQPLVASPEMLNVVRDRVISQLDGLATEGLNWRVEIEYGRPSEKIANKARACDAQLIVIGLVHHGVVDRILDGDTALEVVRQSRAPVLLASADWKAQPKRAVLAVDFSPQSIEAARAGLRLLGDGSTVFLAHVRPMVTVFDGMGMCKEEYETAAAKELQKFALALPAPAGVRVEQVILSGNPAAAMLGLAEEENAELIVCGTRGAGLVQRLLLGSVATRLMRHSTRSLLIVPDSADSA